jgi:hypothetical protein
VRGDDLIRCQALFGSVWLRRLPNSVPIYVPPSLSFVSLGYTAVQSNPSFYQARLECFFTTLVQFAKLVNLGVRRNVDCTLWGLQFSAPNCWWISEDGRRCASYSNSSRRLHGSTFAGQDRHVIQMIANASLDVIEDIMKTQSTMYGREPSRV